MLKYCNIISGKLSCTPRMLRGCQVGEEGKGVEARLASEESLILSLAKSHL